jgi:hypothetical protein
MHPLFLDFSQKYGSYSFRAYKEQTPSEGQFITKLFHLTATGNLRYRVYQGHYWSHTPANLVEDRLLTESDIADESMITTLVKELEEEEKKYIAVSVAEAAKSVSIEQLLN